MQGPFAATWDQLEHTGQQTKGQIAGQAATAVSQFAKSLTDFGNFTDKSLQSQRKFSSSEVSQCTGQNSTCLYIIYDGKVLDLKEFAPYHCGGADVLLKWAGRDASAAMRATNMPALVFDSLINKFCIGTVEPSNLKAADDSAVCA